MEVQTAEETPKLHPKPPCDWCKFFGAYTMSHTHVLCNVLQNTKPIPVSREACADFKRYRP